ncbi:MAG: succinylglutamate desuccinylase/aspartoacylase family protein [Vicinamibacteria bacterium]
MKVFSFLLGIFLTAGAVAQDTARLELGDVSAARGEKKEGFLRVPEGSDPALEIPVAVVHGAKPGPVLSLVAGSHGTEYASIVALVELIRLLDPEEISGSVIIVPIINIPSFERVVPHLNPIDGKNMNRTYPGRAEGSQSERASLAITREVVEKSDHLIDYHGGDLDESLRPYSYWSKTGREEQDRISRELVLAFGLDHIVVSTDRPTDPAASRFLENTATTRGKPSITVEAGHAGTVEPDDVEVLVRGTLSVMRHLKMLAGEPDPVANPVWIEALHSVASESSGLFLPVVQRGSYVQKGMVLGQVTDFFGNKKFDAVAPASGIVLYVRAIPSAVQGDTLASIGVAASGDP